MKTTKKTNVPLFDQCKDKLGCNRYDVITALLDLWADKQIEIKNTNPMIEPCYDYKDYFISKIKLNTFTVTLSHQIGKDLKDWQAINILMYNYLNN
jgi:hypothetical protein